MKELTILETVERLEKGEFHLLKAIRQCEWESDQIRPNQETDELNRLKRKLIDLTKEVQTEIKATGVYLD